MSEADAIAQAIRDAIADGALRDFRDLIPNILRHA